MARAVHAAAAARARLPFGHGALPVPALGRLPAARCWSSYRPPLAPAHPPWKAQFQPELPSVSFERTSASSPRTAPKRGSRHFLPIGRYGIASPAVGGLALDHAALGTLIAGASSLQLLYMTACQTRLIRRHGVRRMVLRQVGDAGPGGSANRAACPSSAKATPRAALRLGAAQANRAAWDACPVHGGAFPT